MLHTNHAVERTSGASWKGVAGGALANSQARLEFLASRRGSMRSVSDAIELLSDDTVPIRRVPTDVSPNSTFATCVYELAPWSRCARARRHRRVGVRHGRSARVSPEPRDDARRRGRWRRHGAVGRLGAHAGRSRRPRARAARGRQRPRQLARRVACVPHLLRPSGVRADGAGGAAVVARARSGVRGDVARGRRVDRDARGGRAGPRDARSARDPVRDHRVARCRCPLPGCASARCRPVPGRLGRRVRERDARGDALAARGSRPRARAGVRGATSAPTACPSRRTPTTSTRTS